MHLKRDGKVGPLEFRDLLRVSPERKRERDWGLVNDGFEGNGDGVSQRI